MLSVVVSSSQTKNGFYCFDAHKNTSGRCLSLDEMLYTLRIISSVCLCGVIGFEWLNSKTYNLTPSLGLGFVCYKAPQWKTWRNWSAFLNLKLFPLETFICRSFMIQKHFCCFDNTTWYNYKVPHELMVCEYFSLNSTLKQQELVWYFVQRHISWFA